ncbi:MAG: hypothetical protein CMJ96_04540 [Planctomycetes bacterium]|nr:hypothetical protein [Planctomycetota bacterium]
MKPFTLFPLLILSFSETSCTLQKAPVVRIAVSVDWEGREISETNLKAFDEFHAVHPDVPLTHFLNAAYFTKNDADENKIVGQIRRAVSPIDELGLHIHPWKSLVEASGVTYRSKPTIWGEGRIRSVSQSSEDVGHDIALESYTANELQAIVIESKRFLEEHGFKLGTSFRAGAWLAGPHVREAIRREGFLIDSSATDTKWHKKIAQYDLPAMIRATWPNVSSGTQPFLIDTPAGKLLEMPDTGALADYVTVEEMVGHIQDAVENLGTINDRFVHIGFHQETAAKYSPRVIAVIKEVKSRFGAQVIFEQLETSAQHTGLTDN